MIPQAILLAARKTSPAHSEASLHNVSVIFQIHAPFVLKPVLIIAMVIWYCHGTGAMDDAVPGEP
jgi:hypothetical protein